MSAIGFPQKPSANGTWVPQSGIPLPSCVEIYNRLHGEFIAILTKYQLGRIASPYTPDLINFMMRKHLDKVQAAVDYSSTLQLINTTIVAQMGLKLDVTAMIREQADKDALYKVMAEWRSTLLWEITMENSMNKLRAAIPDLIAQSRQA